MLTSESRAMLATMISGMVASGLAVVLRIYVRRLMKMPLKVDDFLVIAAWVFSTTLAVTNIIGVPIGGFGVPYQELKSEKKLYNFLKILFILQFWYVIAVALVKLSVLCLYRRIFPNVLFPVSQNIILVVVLGWLISFPFATLFQIWPISCNWRDCVRTSATNYPVMYMWSSATDITIDIVILCLPVFYIRNLALSLSQKIGVAGIFGLGILYIIIPWLSDWPLDRDANIVYSCIVSSIARLVYTITFREGDRRGEYAPNFDSAVVNIIMWSGIEAWASTICASLPCYASLLKSQIHSIKSFGARFCFVFTYRGNASVKINLGRTAHHLHHILSLQEHVIDIEVSPRGQGPMNQTGVERITEKKCKIGEVVMCGYGDGVIELQALEDGCWVRGDCKYAELDLGVDV